MSRSHAGGFARVTVTGYPLGGDSGLVLGVAAGDAASEVAGTAPVTGMDATPANTVGALGLFDMWGDGTLNGDSFLGVGTLREDLLGFCESTLRYALRISDHFTATAFLTRFTVTTTATLSASTRPTLTLADRTLDLSSVTVPDVAATVTEELLTNGPNPTRVLLGQPR